MTTAKGEKYRHYAAALAASFKKFGWPKLYVVADAEVEGCDTIVVPDEHEGGRGLKTQFARFISDVVGSVFFVDADCEAVGEFQGVEEPGAGVVVGISRIAYQTNPVSHLLCSALVGFHSRQEAIEVGEKWWRNYQAMNQSSDELALMRATKGMSFVTSGTMRNPLPNLLHHLATNGIPVRYSPPDGVVAKPSDALRYIYINMTKDSDRKDSFLQEFPGVDWWRFPGCEGGLMWGEIAHGLGLSGDLRHTGADTLRSPRWGTFGCSLSHVFCLKIATVTAGIVMFPDDVSNTRNVDLKKLVSDALEHRPPGVGWIKLKNQKPLYATGEGSIHQSGEHVFRKLKTFDRNIRIGMNTGSAAVIILQEQAKAILAALPPITSTPFDNELQGIVDQVPGGCWEMMDTGIAHDVCKVSVRLQIDKQHGGRHS